MSIVKTVDSLKKKLDEIDKETKIRQMKDGFGAFYLYALDNEEGQWGKGKEVAVYKKVFTATSFNELGKQTGRDREDLKRWYELYQKWPNKQKFMKEYAEPKARKWAERRMSSLLGRDQQSVPEIKELPEGTYTIVYADPPWQFDNAGFTQSAESHYPTLSTDQLCTMNVNEKTEDPAVLFLWSTNAMLEDALKVMQAWGFAYKSNMVWCKKSGVGIGWFVDSRHELLLIGVKGEGLHPQFKPVSWFEAERTEHSRKPDLVYEYIEKMYPNQKYIELFARRKRKGWTSWGNEVK